VEGIQDGSVVPWVTRLEDGRIRAIAGATRWCCGASDSRSSPRLGVYSDGLVLLYLTQEQDGLPPGEGAIAPASSASSAIFPRRSPTSV
jgi:hypothetical protein